MIQYKNLVRSIVKCGEYEDQRAGKDGLRTKVQYCQRMDLDLRVGFPLVTVKRTSFKIVREELNWFLQGKNNVSYLQAQGINIWNDWADADGNLGGSYPGMWRHFGGIPDASHPGLVEEGFDQIAMLCQYFKNYKSDPKHDLSRKRRLILTSWDPSITDNRGPIGCHTLAQWFPCPDGTLRCHLYMRSVDVFLGLPYNIGCYSLLTEKFARMSGLTAGWLTITMGNCHIYENHEPQCEELLKRTVFPLGKLDENLNLIGYKSHPSLKGEIAV